MQREVDVVREAESTCLGAGMLAAAASGVHDSIGAAAAAMSSTAERFEPAQDKAAAYNQLFDVYRCIYPALREVFRRLAEVSAR
jgi:xylulokinase